MQIDISYQKGPIKICISEEIESSDIIQKFKDIIEELEKDSEFFIRFLEEYDENDLTEGTSLIVQKKMIN